MTTVKGHVNGTFHIAGTTDAPILTGQIALMDASAEIPRAGIKLQKGNLTFAMKGTQPIEVTGEIASGEGKITLIGMFPMKENDSLDMKIQGKNFLVANTPSAYVVVSPNLTLKHAAELFTLKGEVNIPRAALDFSQQTTSAFVLSPDVVVLDAGVNESPTTKLLPITSDVMITLGDNVKLIGFGIAGKLNGKIAVYDRPGQVTTGQGEIQVSGAYQAYGQNLKIENGRLLFASTPVDNPALDVRAVREVNDVTVGVHAQGTAQAPQLTLYSEPPMEQSDALAYLVTGQPLSNLNQSENTILNSAARTLGTVTGNLLAKSIGNKLGITDIGIENNALLQSSVFTVGKYLSPKLYLS